MKVALIAVSLLALAQAQQAHPIVFINGASNAVTSTESEGGAPAKRGANTGRDETMEMARTLLKKCPEISITVRDSDPAPDYFLLLNRKEDSFGGASSWSMVLRPDKSVIFASRKGTVASAAREGCKAIMADWKNHRAPHAAAGPLWNKQN